MSSKTRFPLGLGLATLVVAFAVILLASHAPVHARGLAPAPQAPGGFLEPTSGTATRAPLTATQLQSLLPARGVFTFPAPYLTQGVRLTNATDCTGGSDCVYSVGYAYWRNINNHVGSNTMLIALTLLRSQGGAGPSLFSYDKVTGATQNLGALFDPASAFSWATGEGWYFSATMPTKLYVNTPGGSTFYRFDVLTKTFDLLFDVAPSFGSDKYIWQLNSSNDDTVHSFTLRTHTTDAMLGCGVFSETTHQFSYFPAVGSFDECQIDKSGRYLLIKEHTGLGAGGDDDNVIEDLQAATEKVFLDQAGAPGHSDNGFGYMVGEDNWASQPGATRLWNLGLPFPAPIEGTAPGQGTLVYYLKDWSTGLGHVTHANAAIGTPASQQFACVSNANRTNAPRVNELVCFKLDGSLQSLIVAPNMVDLNAAGGGSSDYWKLPKANLDVTGEYMIWTANQGGAREDAFLVRVPSQLLTGTTGVDTTPPTVSVTAPTAGATVSGSVPIGVTATDNVGVTSVSYTLDGAALGSAMTSAPYALVWSSLLSANGTHTLTASASDAAGNVGVSAPVTITVNNPVAGVSISGVTASGMTPSSAAIAWTTSAPADSQVAYGTTTAYTSLTPMNAALVTSHNQALSGLTVGTTYHYQVLSRNGTGVLTASGDATFTTTTASSTLTRAPVEWMSPVNVAVINSGVQKTGGCAGCQDAGAVSKQVITAGDGYVEFTASEPSALREIGLSNGNPGTTLAEIKFGLRMQAGTVEVRESGVYRASAKFGTGDILRVAVTGGKVQYSKNGTLLYTSTATPAYPLLVDSSLCDMKATLKSVVIASATSLPVAWASLVNVTASGTTLQKTGGCAGCADAGAISAQHITSGDGYVEFTASETTSLRAIGLSNGNAGTSLAEIAFAIRLQSGDAEIREAGVYRGDTTFQTGDVFRIAVTHGVVQYSKNGTVFYSSAVAPVYPLLVDTSFNDAGATITNAIIKGGL